MMTVLNFWQPAYSGNLATFAMFYYMCISVTANNWCLCSKVTWKMAFRYLSVRSSAQSHGRDRPHPPQRICTSKHAKAQTPQCVRHSSLHRPVPSPPLPSLLLPPLPIDLAFSFPNGGPRYNNCRKNFEISDARRWALAHFSYKN